MQAKLYVGNLAFNASEDDVKALFVKYGTVMEVNIIRDKYTGQSKGFGFVQLGSGSEAEKALELDGQEFMGRKIAVSEARPQKERSRDSGRDRFDRGRGGYGGQGRRSY